MVIIQLLAGLALLIVGAEALVKGASRIAASFGISSLVIGLTVVAFGTSSPELAVSVMASSSGQSGLALGNVIGSNIFNVLFILGISALIIPLVVHQQLIRIDVPILIGVSLLAWLFAADGSIKFWEGLVLIGLGFVYLWLVMRLSRKEKDKAVEKEYEEAFGAEKSAKSKAGLWRSLVFVVAGLGMLVLGSHWLVSSAVVIAQHLGISDLVIGLTIIAAGTSLPEVATSVIAGMRGERDIAVGNVVGSNLFNLFFILGAAALTAKGGVEVQASALHFDFPVMTAVALACLPVFFTGSKLDRREGFVFIMYYAAYTIYLILSSQKNAALDAYSNAVMWFVIPLTVLTLAAIAWRQSKRKNTGK